MPNSPSNTTSAHPEAPKSSGFRKAIYLALAGLCFMISGDNKKNDIHDSKKPASDCLPGGAEYETDKIMRTINGPAVCGFAGHERHRLLELKNFGKTLTPQDLGRIKALLGRKSVKEIYTEKKDFGELDRSDKKTVPVLEVLPDSLKQILQKYDPEKFKKLNKVLIINQETFARGRYAGRVDKGQNGNLTLTPDGKFLLVSFRSSYTTTDSDFLELLVHEIYGHAFDDLDSQIFSRNFNQSYENAFIDTEKFCEYVKYAMQSEFRAFYHQNHFISWLIESGLPLGVIYKDGYERLRIEEQKDRDIVLYNLFKKGQETGDWTGFKTEIFGHYFDNDIIACQAISVPDNVNELRNIQDLSQKADDERSTKEVDLLIIKAFRDLLTPEKPI